MTRIGKTMLLGLGLTALAGSGWGQTAAIQRTEATIEALSEEILAIDQDIESRVNRIVDLLSGVTDSTDSNRKVASQKEDVAQGLKKMVDWYVRERNKRMSDLSASYQTVGVEELSSEIQYLDEKIESRIDQVLDLSRSLAQHKDVAKYETFAYDSYGGWSDMGVKVSDDYRHNKRISGKTATAQEGVRGGLQKSVDELERTNDILRRQIQVATRPETRAALEEHLARNEELIEHRRDQMVSTVADNSPATRTISSKEASSMDKLIQEMVTEIRDDFRTMERLVNQLRVERQRLKQQQLGARVR